MDTNRVTQEAGNRIRGAKLRESFVASPHIRAACEELQRQFEEEAHPGEAVPDVYAVVDFVNRVARRKFSDYLAADREIRATKSLYAHRAEERDGAATELAAVLAPAKRASDELLPENALKLWLHGPLGRTPASLHRQAEDVAFWGQEARDDLAEPVLRGLRLEVDEIVAEIERRSGRLGSALGSLEEAASHLEATRSLASKAGDACDQAYLHVKATLEAICRLGGQTAAVGKYGPPSLRKLQRSKKRKPQGPVTEQVTQDEVSTSGPLVAIPAASVPEGVPLIERDAPDAPTSHLPPALCSTPGEESDAQTGTRSTAVCKSESAPAPSGSGNGRRDSAVTTRRSLSDGRPSAVTDGFRGERRRRLSVTGGVCATRRSRSEVTETVRSPKDRGTSGLQGVTARIRRFFTRPLGR